VVTTAATGKPAPNVLEAKKDVWNYSVMLNSEPFTSSSYACGDFIINQERVVFVSQFFEPLKVTFRRNYDSPRP
jgi:hypothetical protein